MKAQIAPLLLPPIARVVCRFLLRMILRPSLVVFCSTAGSNSSRTKRA